LTLLPFRLTESIAKVGRKNDYSKFMTKKIQNNNFTSLVETKI